MGSVPLPRLAYAPAPRLRGLWRYRRYWRQALAAALLIAGALAAARAVVLRSEPFLRQAEVLAEQQKMTDFDPPAGTVALTSDPEECARLYSTGNYVEIPDGFRGWGGDWRGYVPVPLTPANTRPGEYYPTLFVHWRQVPTGRPRLVHVTAGLWTSDLPFDAARPFLGKEQVESIEKYNVKPDNPNPKVNFCQLVLQSEIYELATRKPGTTLRPIPRPAQWWVDMYPLIVPSPKTEVQRWQGRDGDWHYRGVPLRVLVGRPDPDDPARFTIGYEYDGQSGAFVGRLTEDDRIDWDRIVGPLRRWPRG